jgi:chemotaxis protein MotA
MAAVAGRHPRQAASRRGVDPATALGLIAGFGLILGAIAVGGRPQAFIDLPAILIVFGGTAAVIAISHSPSDMLALPALVLRTLVRQHGTPRKAARILVDLATWCRRHGMMAMDSRLRDFAGQPLLQHGLAMAIDSVAEAEITSRLEWELAAMRERHRQSVAILRRAAEVAPAMGLIGTLVGLVQMLGSLDDPASIGPAMAVALLTTFYGAVLSHMAFTPMAVKLERSSVSEQLVGRMQMLTALSIRRQENPRRLQAAIDGLLPVAGRDIASA